LGTQRHSRLRLVVVADCVLAMRYLVLTERLVWRVVAMALKA
jgi:hypothetical protein